MSSTELQQFANAYPVLVVVAAFIIGAIAFLAVRIVLANVSCLLQLGCAIMIIIAILLLLWLLLSH